MENNNTDVKEMRPNIVLITSDQQRGVCFGFEGRQVLTPHLDRLAREGTRFGTCITPNLVCAPSRASILTGLLPLTHGVWDNGVDLDERVGDDGFAGQFSNAGYRTGFIGKAHFSTYQTFAPTGRPECIESSADFDESWHGPYMGFDHVEIVLIGHNMFLPMKPPRGLHYDRWYHNEGLGDYLDQEYRRHVKPGLGAFQTHHSGLPLTWHNSTWIGDRTIDYLREHQEEPFCLWVSFPDPHHPFDCPVPWSSMYSPDDVDIPKHRTLDLDRRPRWHRESLESTPTLSDARFRAFRENSSRAGPQSDAQLREMTANYYGMISLIDHNVGRIMIALRDLGLSDNTIVVYTSDHGDWLGDHGLYLKGPMAYEGLLRVGLIFSGPGIPKNKVIGDPVSTLDLAATFHDYCHVPTSRNLHSRSLKPLIEGSSETRDFAYSEWKLHSNRCGIAPDLRTVRTERYKLTLELESGDGELYDLESDPNEMDNLLSDDGRVAIRKELTDMIRERPEDVRNDLAEPVGIA